MQAETVKRGPGRPPRFAPPPEPKVVFDTSPVKKVTRRLSDADLQKHASWLIPAIQERWGGPSVVMVNGWLRQWRMGNEYNIACTDNAVALAELSHDPLDPVPVIREVFMFCPDEHAEDMVALYWHFVRWGRSVKASEFRFSKPAAERKEMLKTMIPGFKWRSNCYLEIDE